MLGPASYECDNLLLFRALDLFLVSAGCAGLVTCYDVESLDLPTDVEIDVDDKKLKLK